MQRDFPNHHTLEFRVLSDRQIVKVYQAALETLKRTGVDVYNEEARDLLAGAGAEVDGQRVYIPPHIIQDAIAASPRSFTLWSRDGKPSIQVVPDNVYFGPGPTCTYFIDPESGERRKVLRGDPGLTACVADGLQQIDYVMGLGMISDVHPELSSVYEFAEMAANTTKPILQWANSLDNMRDIYDIAVAIAGDEKTFRRKPFMGLFATFQSPLIHVDEDLSNALWAAERGLPIIYLGGGTAGSTAPVTAAGLFVIYLAGALSGLAILQLKKRGTPVCLGGVPQATDMRTARPSYGSPEMALYSAAMSDIARYFGVPFMGTAGASESKMVDVQAAIESTMQVVLSGLSGATLVHDVGFLDCADIGSLEMLVMTDEIIAMTRRIMRGIEISDETLMLDEINQIGPGGEFLSSAETARLCRKEIWIPKLADRDPWTQWDEKDRPTMNDNIRQKVRDLIANHDPAPLPDGVPAKIDAILARAEKRVSPR